MTSKWQNLRNRSGLTPYGLILAVLLSLLLHFLMLGGEFWHLPSMREPAQEPEHRQLVTILAEQKAVPAALPSPKPHIKPRQKAATRARARPGTETPVQAAPPAPALETADVATMHDPQPEAEPAADAGAAMQPEPEQASDDSGAAEKMQVQQRDLPQFSYVDTEFEVLRGVNGSKIGTSHIQYRALADGRYELTSTTEAKGLAALVISGKLLQQSRGEVTDQGLRPDSFLYQYGSSEAKKQQSRFDWMQHTVTLETAKGIKTVALPDGSQDLLSFMYQFVFVPPLEQMALSVSNGRKLTSFSYEFEGEEVLNLAFGVVKTLHITKSSQEGSDKTELWLAVDYLYLPVKMRKTEEDGSVIEQMAVRISTDLLK